VPHQFRACLTTAIPAEALPGADEPSRSITGWSIRRTRVRLRNGFRWSWKAGTRRRGHGDSHADCTDVDYGALTTNLLDSLLVKKGSLSISSVACRTCSASRIRGTDDQGRKERRAPVHSRQIRFHRRRGRVVASAAEIRHTGRRGMRAFLSAESGFAAMPKKSLPATTPRSMAKPQSVRRQCPCLISTRAY